MNVRIHWSSGFLGEEMYFYFRVIQLDSDTIVCGPFSEVFPPFLSQIILM